MNNTTNTAAKLPWKRFHRFLPHTSFWGVIDNEGNWVDSSVTFPGAQWNGATGLGGVPDNLDEAAKRLQDAGYSIIHSSLLEKMYEAGLIK